MIIHKKLTDIDYNASDPKYNERRSISGQNCTLANLHFWPITIMALQCQC